MVVQATVVQDRNGGTLRVTLRNYEEEAEPA